MVPLRFLDGGETMLVVEFGTTVDPAINDRVLALDAAFAAVEVPGVVERVPTFRSLAIHYDPLVIDRATLVERVTALEATAEVTPRAVRRWRIPICHAPPHGEDLAEVAARLGIGVDAVIARHAATIHRVHMYGFAPGFAYLGGLDPRLALPRRATPRPPHPANAVMIAAGMAALASVPMPTGWWVIGRSAERLFALDRDPAFLVAVGDEIRFEPVDAATFAGLDARAAAGEIVAVAEPCP